MRKKQPDVLVVFLGDLHVGSTCAPAPKAECRNREMERLLVLWESFVVRAKAAAKGKALVLMLGGDIVDGRHHNMSQTWGQYRDQRNGAIALLQPLANIASAVYAVKGTEAHAGGDGEDDQTVAEALGAKQVPYAWRMIVGGKRLFWTHHLTNSVRDISNQDSGMLAAARRQFELHLRGEEKPDLMIGHHTHFCPTPISRHGITVALAPCWQTSTAFGYRIGAEKTPDIGVLAWWPVQNRLERWLYPLEQPYVEIKTD